jgi:hypothetical protein
MVLCQLNLHAKFDSSGAALGKGIAAAVSV